MAVETTGAVNEATDAAAGAVAAGVASTAGAAASACRLQSTSGCAISGSFHRQQSMDKDTCTFITTVQQGE